MEKLLQGIISDRKLRTKESIFRKENDQAGYIFRRLCKTFEDPDIELRICNTYAKTSSLLKLGNTQYLIYDEYLTETLNALNLLYFEHGHRPGIKRYVCRLMADQFFACGKYDAALYMVREYIGREPYFKEGFLSPQLEQTAIGSAVIQQWFIIAHEIGHWFIDENNKRAQILARKKGFLMEIFSHGKQDAMKAHICQKIQEKETISEECFCDSAASMLVLDVLREKYSAEQIMEACFLALEHVRILADIETFVGTCQRAGEDFALQSTIRLAHMRFLLSELLKDDSGEAAGNRMFKRLGDIFEDYNDSLYHPAVEVLDSSGREGVRYAIYRQNTFSRKDVEEFLEELI